MRTDSLAFRLFVAAAVWSVVALLAAGLIITALYRASVERGFDARLDVYAKTIIAALVDTPQNPQAVTGTFGEPRFGLPLSGWYWQVEGRRGRRRISVAVRCPLAIPQHCRRRDGRRPSRLCRRAVRPKTLHLLVRVVHIGDETYNVAVAGNADEVAAGSRLLPQQRRPDRLASSVLASS
ncbi:MAG: hypothetical protein R3D02_13780 [Hyphomicrobiales bacterium]